jgi:two-component sensor histidine kinase/HAMP domain-containing protein
VQYSELSADGQRCFLQVSPIKDEYGIDWLIAVVIPEADYMAQINAQNRTTAFFIIAALAAVIIIGVVAAQLITRPIIQLIDSARALARNDWTRPLPDDSRVREISELTLSFNKMTGRLQQSLEGLTKEIVERKMAEEAIRAALNEKEILLREIHHRVKNNLQIVISLLNLQAGQLKNPSMTDALQVSQQRIRAMAMIHETLHDSQSLVAIDLSTYLTNLVQQLYGVFNGQADVRIAVEASEIGLGMDQAIACGLIINELVANAVKYAFPGKTGGRVHVRARRIEDTQVELTVSDNGVGLPSDFDLAGASSLGLQLVRGLVAHQLAGTCRVHVNGGTIFTIQWPLHADKV